MQSNGHALDGKVAIITGSASGIGAACARAMAQAGALPDAVRVLPEVDEEDFQSPGFQISMKLLDGRQLLPAGGSPRGPEEEHHDLAAKRHFPFLPCFDGRAAWTRRTDCLPASPTPG